MVFGIIAIIVIILLVAWFVSTYNSLIRTKMQVKEAFSTMDVFLKKRFDLIPNIVETVKGYAGHESDTLSKVVELRSKMASSGAGDAELEKEMSGAISRLLMVAESYPELKADTQFLNLQSQLSKIEEDIEMSRRYYNGAVKELNSKVNMIPTNIVAGICNIKEESFFELQNPQERENVKVQF